MSFLERWPSWGLTGAQLSQANARLVELGRTLDVGFLANARPDVGFAYDLWHHGDDFREQDPPSGQWFKDARFYRFPKLDAWVVLVDVGGKPGITAHPGLNLDDLGMLLGPCHGHNALELLDPEFRFPESGTAEDFDAWLEEVANRETRS